MAMPSQISNGVAAHLHHPLHLPRLKRPMMERKAKRARRARRYLYSGVSQVAGMPQIWH